MKGLFAVVAFAASTMASPTLVSGQASCEDKCHALADKCANQTHPVGINIVDSNCAPVWLECMLRCKPNGFDSTKNATLSIAAVGTIVKRLDDKQLCYDEYISCVGDAKDGDQRQIICNGCWEICKTKGHKACSVCKLRKIEGCPPTA